MNIRDSEPTEESRIITVAGHVGSGKSAVCQELRRLTSWPVLSTGTLFRGIAAELRMSVLELNQYAKSHREIDDEVDARLQQLADKGDSIIIDSRLAWHFLPHGLKVYLVVDPKIAAARIYNALRPDEKYTSVEAAYKDSDERQRIEADRYHSLYGVRTENWLNYDVVVDTSHATPSRVAEIVLAGDRRNPVVQAKAPDCWLSPRRLIPTQDIRELARANARAVFQEVQDHGLDPMEPIDVAVHEDSYLIVDGHARVSAAIRTGHPLIRCNLVAYEQEEILPGLSLSEFAETAPSLSRMYDWEDANQFTYESYPDWLTRHEA